MKIHPILAFTVCLAGPALASAASSVSQPPGLFSERTPMAFTMPGAVQHDFTARTNRLPYRVMVWAPADAKTRAYPVIYLLDGNMWFPGAAAEGWHFNNAIIIGIGVPTELLRERPRGSGRER